MRRIILLLVVLLVGSSLRADLIDGINVIVNDTVITYQEVENGIAPLVETLANQYSRDRKIFEQELHKLRARQVEDLVARQLILHDFKTAGYNLPESVVDDLVNDQIRQRFGNRATLTKTLQAQGVTYETFRKREREDYIIAALTKKNISAEKILISPHKIEAYYREHEKDFKLDDQIKLRMIVINQPPNGAPGTARKLAQEILDKIKAGASFAEMASVYSDGPQRAQGGDRGWVDRNHFRKELSDVAFSLKAGEHSGIVEVADACYLLKVEDAHLAHVKPLPDVRDEIEGILKTEERSRLQKKWLDRLKQKSFVRYY
jgi:parvulin-like peptidyl-prolyl isomerase